MKTTVLLSMLVGASVVVVVDEVVVEPRHVEGFSVTAIVMDKYGMWSLVNTGKSVHVCMFTSDFFRWLCVKSQECGFVSRVCMQKGAISN